MDQTIMQQPFTGRLQEAGSSQQPKSQDGSYTAPLLETPEVGSLSSKQGMAQRLQSLSSSSFSNVGGPEKEKGYSKMGEKPAKSVLAMLFTWWYSVAPAFAQSEGTGRPLGIDDIRLPVVLGVVFFFVRQIYCSWAESQPNEEFFGEYQNNENVTNY